MLKRILIANRGEVALRIIRACRKAGVEALGVYSQADVGSPHVWASDRAVCIGPPAAESSYLAADALVATALATACDAVHPGYGFLAENVDFATRCRDVGLAFIGPAPELIALMGDKVTARAQASSLGIPVVPGSPKELTDATAAAVAAKQIGFPLLLKASAGGGGRGMRIVREPRQLEERFSQACGEAKAAFGDGRIYLERYFERVRHIEVQIFGDTHGGYRHLGERDCSVQRRHQKLVEEAPSPVLGGARRREICDAALALAESIEYTNAGTVEFIVDLDGGGYYFIEMNTRIQVEHPVTEAVTGVDLVLEQLRVAAGERLSFADADLAHVGHAVEWRINAEDADRDFLPTPGTVTRWRPPRGRGIRLDSHVYEGYRLPPYYDSLIGKLIISGHTRDEALARSRRVLDGFRVNGISTTIPFHRALLDRGEFLRGEVHTRWVEQEGHGLT